MKRFFLLLILAFSCTKLVSQDMENVSVTLTQSEMKYDTTRIINLTDKLNLYTGFFGKIHNIELTNSDINKKLILEPNGKTSIGLGFNYKWIGLGVNFSPGFLNQDNEKYGNTESLDLQLNLYARTFGIDAYLQYYKGFYQKNPDDFMNWTNENYPLRPNLESFSFGLSGYYFTNHKRFSYKAAFTRNQVQKKSAGSFIAGAFINASVASAPKGFIPQELPDSLSLYYNMEGYVTSSLGVSCGYTYTFVVKRFFFNATLVPGLGIRNAEFLINNNSAKEDATISASVNLRAAIGYEGKKIYAGLTMVSSADTYSYESVDISSSSGNIKLFIGKRFNASTLFHKK